jgi:predicted SAM-dependent methyltransferase
VLSDSHYRVPWPKDILIHDLNRALPFADASVDVVYSSHALEHLSREQGKQLLYEVHRVLRSDGLLRLIVPDLEFGVRRYLQTLNGEEGTQASAHLLNWLGLCNREARAPHLWMYDEPALRQLLTDAGFVRIRRCTYRQGEAPDLETLDNRPEDSLHLEAQKPTT